MNLELELELELELKLELELELEPGNLELVWNRNPNRTTET